MRLAVLLGSLAAASTLWAADEKPAPDPGKPAPPPEKPAAPAEAKPAPAPETKPAPPAPDKPPTPDKPPAPAVGAPPAAEPVAPDQKPEVAAVLRELEWVPGSAADFQKLLARAKAAEVPDSAVVFPVLDASLLFGDVATLKTTLPQAEAAKIEAIKRKGGTDEAREEINHSLKLARRFLLFAEKRPTEVERRAEIFRGYLFAMQTLEDCRALQAALDQLGVEKSLAAGTAVTWEQLSGYLEKKTQLAGTGTTIFGDKFGPFKIGEAPRIPAATFDKLKAYLPADQWEGFAPKP